MGLHDRLKELSPRELEMFTLRLFIRFSLSQGPNTFGIFDAFPDILAEVISKLETSVLESTLLPEVRNEN
jgi:hypothetical protein